jgi:hypothetical protein
MKKSIPIFILLFCFVLLIISCGQDNTTEPPSNTSPNTPSNPHPSDEEDSVSIHTFLGWSCNDPDLDVLTYDIYLGTTQNPPHLESGVENIFYFPDPLTDNSTYYWKVVARDDQGATTSGSVWQFHTLEAPGNNVPNTPTNPYPEHGATGIAPPVTLTWSCTDPDSDALTYHLYWGITESLENYVTNLDTSAYTVLNITPWAHYYWKVIAEDEHGAATEGPLWEFDAAPGSANRCPEVPSDPSPPNSVTGVDTVDVLLSWECSDPDGDSLSYTVRWGTTPVMTNGVKDLAYTTFVLYHLNSGIKYFWQVIAEDEHGCETPGPVWTFWTAEGLEILISNTVTMSYWGDPAIIDSYDLARSTSWSQYIGMIGEPGWFDLAGTVGQGAYITYSDLPPYLWAIFNSGFYYYGDYDLDSKAGYSSASCKLTYVLGQPSDNFRTLLPFYIQFYINGALAGQMQYQSPGTNQYEEFEFPIDFNSVITGSKIHVEVRSNKFMQENPAPLAPPAELYTEYLEWVVIGWTRIILR